MNTYFRLTCIVMATLWLAACDQFDGDFYGQAESSEIVDNSESIDKLIQSLDKTLIAYLDSGFELAEEELAESFLKEAESLGMRILPEYPAQPNARTGRMPNPVKYSDEFYRFAELIAEPSANESNKVYTTRLRNANNEIRKSNIPASEKQLLIDNLVFMDSFVNWMEGVDRNHSRIPPQQLLGNSCNGWWACWGRCTAKVAGSAMTGAVLGCGTVGVIGGTAGMLAGIKGAAVGALLGCFAGAVVYGIGSGLEGYADASYCQN